MAKLLLASVAIFLFATNALAQNLKPLKAIAVIRSLDGGPIFGNVTFSQNGCGESVLVDVAISGLQYGVHGFHVHEKGDLSNGCASTGGHYNPDKLDHGAPNDPVRHVGDLGNINVDETGSAITKFSDQLINLGGPRSIIGRAVVIHEKPDDLGKGGHPDSKKTGNAGGRVACGVIGIVSPSEHDWPCSAGYRSTISSAVLFLTFTLYIYAFM